VVGQSDSAGWQPKDQITDPRDRLLKVRAPLL
jgi:hypothetical protein